MVVGTVNATPAQKQMTREDRQQPVNAAARGGGGREKGLICLRRNEQGHIIQY